MKTDWRTAGAGVPNSNRRRWLLWIAVLCLGDRLAGAVDLPPIVQTLDSQWSLRLDAPADGPFVAVPVPLGLYIVARDDLADVRILSVDVSAKNALEVPYTAVQPVDETAFRAIDAEVNGPQQVADGIQFELAFRSAPQAINEIQIEVDAQSHNYRREVLVYGRTSGEEAEATLTTAGLLYDVQHESDSIRICRVRFAEGEYSHCRVVILNGAEPALPISVVRAVHRTERRPLRSEIPAVKMDWTPDPAQQTTSVEADLDYRNIPTTGVKLDIDSTEDFCRTAHIDATDHPEQSGAWQRAGTFDVYRFTLSTGEVVEQTAVDYPAVRGGYVRVTIENHGERPLSVQQVTATSITRLLVCERKFLQDQNRQVSLYAGDRHRSAPEQILNVPATLDPKPLAKTVIVGQRKANQFKLKTYDPGVLQSEQERDRTWNLTVSLFVAIVVIAGVIVWRRSRRQVHDES